MPGGVPRTALIFSTLFLALIGLGCGSGNGDPDDGESNEAAGQLTHSDSAQAPKQPNRQQQPKGQFVRQANAICRKLISDSEDVRRRYLFEPDTRVRQQGFSSLAHEVRVALVRMESLRQPATDQRAIGRLYRAAKAGAATLDQAANNPQVAQQILSGVNPFEKTALLARSYGLTACQATAGVTGSP